MAKNRIYIPYYISNENFAPAKVLPRIFFYNGTKDCDIIKVQYYNTGSTLVTVDTFTAFPYFDNYSGEVTTTSSLSLLFTNEDPVYGVSYPSQSLYEKYWSKYIDLLYSPKTRLLRCSAVLPFDVYQQLELNDIVQLRSNYYHLRAINDYNLRTGECRMELLGPILEGSLDNLFPTYYSSALTASVQKNDCAVGYTGSFYNVILPASYSVSTQSYQEAQNEAQTYFNSITQSVANASGSCILNSLYFGTYNIQINNTFDNTITTSLYPVTVSFYTTTSINVPSETSSEWQIVGYINSGSNLANQTSSFTVTARKNWDLTNNFNVSNKSGSFYNLIKLRGNNGEKLSGMNEFVVLGSSPASASISSSFYYHQYFLSDTGSNATGSYKTSLFSHPVMYNDATQSFRREGDIILRFQNGTTGSNIVTGSVSGMLTMSYMSMSYSSPFPCPSASNSEWRVIGYVSQSWSGAYMLQTVNGTLTEVQGGSIILSGSSFTSAGKNNHLIKLEDNAGNPVNWNTNFISAVTDGVTLSYGCTGTAANGILRLVLTNYEPSSSVSFIDWRWIGNG